MGVVKRWNYLLELLFLSGCGLASLQEKGSSISRGEVLPVCWGETGEGDRGTDVISTSSSEERVKN